MAKPLILTATMDDAAQAFFDAQRQAYFPPERNYLRAHITLFHALPAEHEVQLAEAIRSRLPRSELPATVAGLRMLGGGVAFAIECGELNALRDRLAARWQPWLSPQDRQGFRAHVTVQNKVQAAEARALFQALNAGFAPWSFNITGLKLWTYEGGPWALREGFAFSM